MNYRGWTISEFTENGKPHFYAAQAGVTMNTNTLEGIKRMIDRKIYERRELDRGPLPESGSMRHFGSDRGLA